MEIMRGIMCNSNGSDGKQLASTRMRRGRMRKRLSLMVLNGAITDDVKMRVSAIAPIMMAIEL